MSRLFNARLILRLSPEKQKVQQQIGDRKGATFDFNRMGGEKSGIGASVANVDGKKYILTACPKDIAGAGRFFDEALKLGTAIFVSTHESDEEEVKCPDFWKQRVIGDPVFAQNCTWRIEHVAESIIATGVKEPNGAKEPRIIKSDLLAISSDGTQKIALTHLHYEGWRNREPMADERLFDVLFREVDQVHTDKTTPISINCKGGVGRTGVSAVLHSALSEIQRQVKEGCALGEAQVNIPQIIYSLKLQRGIIEKPKQIAEIHAFLGNYFERAKH